MTAALCFFTSPSLSQSLVFSISRFKLLEVMTRLPPSSHKASLAQSRASPPLSSSPSYPNGNVDRRPRSKVTSGRKPVNPNSVWVCHICHRPLASRSGLSRHLETHDPNTRYVPAYPFHANRMETDGTGDRKHPCAYPGCSKVFRQKSNMLTHLNIQYVIPFLQSAFVRSPLLAFTSASITGRMHVPQPGAGRPSHPARG